MVRFKLSFRIVLNGCRSIHSHENTTIIDNYKSLVADGIIRYDEKQFSVSRLLNKLAEILNVDAEKLHM